MKDEFSHIYKPGKSNPLFWKADADGDMHPDWPVIQKFQELKADWYAGYLAKWQAFATKYTGGFKPHRPELPQGGAPQNPDELVDVTVGPAGGGGKGNPGNKKNGQP
jgi:hypothetical protein